jgi:7-cyano-7-deazaguanine tRNA-ribosyltransferase
LAVPLFLPVYEPGNPYLTLAEMQEQFGVRAIMVNAFFLYRDPQVRRQVLERGIKDHLGFDGLVATDSGAFQAFRQRLFLKNKTIVQFQQDIGADIISPLDVVSSPKDNFSTAEGKLGRTMGRIEEALEIADDAVLMGVQQGGRFMELRRRAARQLVELGVDYIALGSLVPFFSQNHNLEFVGEVVGATRGLVPEGIPLHLYGAGDPLELPFYVALGCDVFDSSAFVHYAEKGSYMTPYGAWPSEVPYDEEFYQCPCPWCGKRGGGAVREDVGLLVRHNLWTALDAVDRTRALLREESLMEFLDEAARYHMMWFPASFLGRSWGLEPPLEEPPP